MQDSYSNVAQHQSQQIGVDGTDLVSEVDEVSQAEVTLSDETLAASVDETNADDTAQQTELTTLLPEEVQAVENGDAAVVQDVGGDANAQAAYETSVSQAIAQYYQDKAAATAADDQAVAAASVTEAGTMQPDLATYYVELNTNSPTLEDITADGQAAGATFQASAHSAWLTQIGGYGDAEITESKSIGTAQITLATSLGGDELTLATAEAGVANTLAAEEATADETLTDAIDSQNTTDAETTADDQASTTSDEGADEIAAQQALATEEVTTAGLLAGDQADYAIATAQYLAAAAAALAQPTGANQFASLYAQGYVTWLSDLKASFVSNATAVAQAAANDEVALTTADATLADQEATDNANEVTTEAPQSATESETIETESNTYQTSLTSNVGQDQTASATADQQQMIALAQAASTFITANAQADKDAQLNADNGVSDWQAIQTKAIADAKLALTDSQADADQAWIDGKSTADKQFLTADAGAWQTMNDAEAGTNDQLAHQEDDDAETEDEAVAGDESTALTSEATADQTQGNADASGAAAFQIAEGNETSTIWNWLAGQLGNTPWAVSQAGLAGAEASWAATAASNYQTYVTSLGTAEVAYQASNAAQFVSEIDAIDAADDTAGNTAADDGLTLADALDLDEATFEETLAPAGATYQQEVGSAQDVYRKAIAQADLDLAIGTLTDYGAAVAAAQSAQTAAYDQAYADFATLVAPAMTLQGDDDANAEQTDSNNDAAANLTDIQTNNAAVDTYDDQESAAYDTQQKAQALALQVMQTADASGHASAIASYDQSNPSPWADLSAAQTAALSAQLTSQANALLSESNALADAQETLEKAQADALETRDNADAQAEETQTTTDAQATHDEETAKAAATDAVFSYLPYTLIAPTDGPAPVLTPDFQQLYEANDFVLQQYAGNFWQTGQFLGGGNKWTDAPDFMAGVSLLGPAVYDWQGYSSQVPLTPVAAGPSAWTPSSGDVSFASTAVIYGGGGQTYSNPSPFKLQDLLRSDLLPLPAVYTAPMHFVAPAAVLLLSGPVGQGKGKVDRSNDSWLSRMFETKFPDEPPELPSAAGGVVPANNNGGTYSKINSRGVMRPGRGLMWDNQHSKNGMLAGNFTTAIYEGIADVLEDEIWNLATFGILGEAEGELIQVATRRTWKLVTKVIDVTIGKVTKTLSADDFARIERLLKDRGLPHSVDDVANAIKDFGQHELRHAVNEIVEKMCFAPDTLVSTERGARRIGDVHPGELVYAYDFPSGGWLLAEVLRRHDNRYTGWMFTLIAGESRIEITANHPVWVVEGADLHDRIIPGDLARGEDEGHSLPGRWVNSHELRPGDAFISRDGERRRLDAVESRFERSFAVCNLTVRGHHTFAAGDDAILVHNTGWCTTLAKYLDKPPDLVTLAESLGLDASRVHAHHIVMRNYQTGFSKKARDALDDSKRILKEAGIELFDDATAAKNGVEATKDFANRANAGNIQNFAWAINNYEGIHREDYVIAVWEKLKAVDHKGKAAVQKVLSDIRDQLQAGVVFWKK